MPSTQSKKFYIEIVQPCYRCTFIEWKPDKRYSIFAWYCCLFDCFLRDIDGTRFTHLSDKKYCRPCAECRQLTERYSKLPELPEGK